MPTSTLQFYWKCARLAAEKVFSFANNWQWLFGIPTFIFLLVWGGQNLSKDGKPMSFPDTTTVFGALEVALGAFLITWFFGFIINMIKSPAILYRGLESYNKEIQKKLESVSIDRPFTYHNMKLVLTPIKDNLYNFDLTLIFENIGDKMIKYDMKLIEISVNGKIPAAGITFNTSAFVPGKYTSGYSFPTIENVLVSNFPIEILINFVAEYDNVPALKVRTTAKKIQYMLPSFDMNLCRQLIIEQDER